MKTIAIVGATGLVGQKLRDVFDASDVKADFLLFANKSAGSRMTIQHKALKVMDVKQLPQYRCDAALFVADADTSIQYIPQLAANGTLCIDNSSAFRMNDDVPLVVWDVNGNTIKNHKLIANPNCTTIQLVTALNAVKKFGIKRIVVSTYQAVSGGGKTALYDLEQKHSYGKLQHFPHPIYDNVIPHIDQFLDNGYTKEEMKVVNESQKILNQHIEVSCIAVRVPVTVGHSLSVNVELENMPDIDTIRKQFLTAKNVLLTDNTQTNLYPMPLSVRGTPFVSVGRITKDLYRNNCFNCFITADNLLRGAAYNAYEILVNTLWR